MITVNVATKVQIPSDEQYVITCRTSQDRNVRRASGGQLFNYIFHHVTVSTQPHDNLLLNILIGEDPQQDTSCSVDVPFNPESAAGVAST